LAVLRELVRVVMEIAWERGAPRPLADYLVRFPILRTDRASLQAVAFEEYRLRQQAGQDPDPEAYQRDFGVDTADWSPPSGAFTANQGRASTPPASAPA